VQRDWEIRLAEEERPKLFGGLQIIDG